jgi:hypothetical protein
LDVDINDPLRIKALKLLADYFASQFDEALEKDNGGTVIDYLTGERCFTMDDLKVIRPLGYVGIHQNFDGICSDSDAITQGFKRWYTSKFPDRGAASANAAVGVFSPFLCHLVGKSDAVVFVRRGFEGDVESLSFRFVGDHQYKSKTLNLKGLSKKPFYVHPHGQEGASKVVVVEGETDALRLAVALKSVGGSFENISVMALGGCRLPNRYVFDRQYRQVTYFADYDNFTPCEGTLPKASLISYLDANESFKNGFNDKNKTYLTFVDALSVINDLGRYGVLETWLSNGKLTKFDPDFCFKACEIPLWLGLKVRRKAVFLEYLKRVCDSKPWNGFVRDFKTSLKMVEEYLESPQLDLTNF